MANLTEDPEEVHVVLIFGRVGNDDKIENETVKVRYPPPNYNWDGELHIQLRPIMHGNTLLVVVAAIDEDIDEGNFVEGEGQLQVGNILTKVDGEEIDSYEYDELMDHIADLMPLTSDAEDEKLLLTLKRDNNSDDLKVMDN